MENHLNYKLAMFLVKVDHTDKCPRVLEGATIQIKVSTEKCWNN